MMHLSEVEPRSRQRANFQSPARNALAGINDIICLRGSELIIGLQGSTDDRFSMRSPETDELDRKMMIRCIALSVRSGEKGEYPYGAVIRGASEIVSGSINRVPNEGDVTRHAEVVAISGAQKALGTVNLEDCEIYASAEPCVYCSYAIRESRLGRVIYSLRSPHMGGVSKWSVLTDKDLSNTMPEVFEPPPEIIAGFMAYETERALLSWNPLMWGILKMRGLLVAGPVETMSTRSGADGFLMKQLCRRRKQYAKLDACRGPISLT